MRFTGEPIDAAQAVEMELLNRVVLVDELPEQTGSFASTVGDNATVSVIGTKEIVD